MTQANSPTTFPALTASANQPNYLVAIQPNVREQWEFSHDFFMPSKAVEQRTCVTAAVTFSASLLGGSSAVITALTNNIFFTLDGTTPSYNTDGTGSSIMVPAGTSTPVFIVRGDQSTLKIISNAATIGVAATCSLRLANSSLLLSGS